MGEVNTTSLSFPNMFDVSRNRVSVLEDNTSIVNRCKLLILTEPTELYNDLTFGVGLKRHLWKYNTDNEKAIIKSRIVEQIRENEPCVNAETISFSDGLLFTGSSSPSNVPASANSLEMTVGLTTRFGDNLKLDSDQFYNFPYTINKDGTKSYIKS